MDKTYLTEEELAERWKLKKNTFAQWRHHKKEPIPYTKIGGSVRYDLKDVEEYEANNKRGGSDDR